MFADPLIAYTKIGPGRLIVTKCFQPHVDCEMVTKYSPIFFKNVDECFVFLYNNSDQKWFFNTLMFARSLGDLKTFFMLNSTVHKISTADNN